MQRINKFQIFLRSFHFSRRNMNTARTFIIFIIFSIILFVENKKLQKSFEVIFGDGWHLKEEANLAQIMAQENDQQKRNGENGENDQQRKKEIIRKFREIKEKIKQQKGIQSSKEWHKFECTIAKKLGTSRTTIYRRIRELGMVKRKMQTNEQKLTILRQYWEMKWNNPKMSDRKIANGLKISRESIRKWKGQFRKLRMRIKKQIVSTTQKRKIVRQFQTIKEQIKQKVQKYSRVQWNKIDCLLAKKLGTSRTQIYEWIKQLGMGQKRTQQQRMEKISQYWAMKRNDPKMSDEKIAKALKIGKDSIRKWKCQ